ncbi:MAG TPA: hypothetical protein VHV79_04360 [Mycobacteriales bacterium]|nr:hypothetical protein [Mycobacteriales bacterium]
MPSGATVKIKSLRPAHSGKALAFTLAKAVRTRLAHHHRVKATLTLKVKGQLTSKVHFTIH